MTRKKWTDRGQVDFDSFLSEVELFYVVEERIQSINLKLNDRRLYIPIRHLNMTHR